MASKNFLLLSMEDNKIKKVSNVISNDSCRKILDYLSSKEATESELAEKLQIPISTVHYNLQQLMETGLINAEEFHYSKKGKEVSHYKIANKYIIIAPKKTFGIKEKLKGILPVALIASGVAAVIQLVSNYFSRANIYTSQRAIVAKSVAESEFKKGVVKSAQTLGDSTVGASTYILQQNIALWFLIGALFALIVYFLISLRRKNFDA